MSIVESKNGDIEIQCRIKEPTCNTRIAAYISSVGTNMVAFMLGFFGTALVLYLGAFAFETTTLSIRIFLADAGRNEFGTCAGFEGLFHSAVVSMRDLLGTLTMMPELAAVFDGLCDYLT